MERENFDKVKPRFSSRIEKIMSKELFDQSIYNPTNIKNSKEINRSISSIKLPSSENILMSIEKKVDSDLLKNNNQGK